MKYREIVDKIRIGEHNISEIAFEMKRDDLLRLVGELDYALYSTAKKLARMRGKNPSYFFSEIGEVYGCLADNLEEMWTDATGKWLDE